METSSRHIVEANTHLNMYETETVDARGGLRSIAEEALAKTQAACQLGHDACMLRLVIDHNMTMGTAKLTYRCVSEDEGQQCQLLNGPYLANDMADSKIYTVLPQKP